MTKRKKLLICFFLALSVVTLQFTLDRREHLRLAANGIVVNATSTYHKDWSGEYAHFTFTTKGGRQIEHSQKCGSKKTFDEQYANMQIIYNAKNPDEFINWYSFASYSLNYRLFFYFGIYLTFLTFFLYVLERNVKGLYKFFKGGLRPSK